MAAVGPQWQQWPVIQFPDEIRHISFAIPLPRHNAVFDLAEPQRPSLPFAQWSTAQKEDWQAAWQRYLAQRPRYFPFPWRRGQTGLLHWQEQKPLTILLESALGQGGDWCTGLQLTPDRPGSFAGRFEFADQTWSLPWHSIAASDDWSIAGLSAGGLVNAAAEPVSLWCQPVRDNQRWRILQAPLRQPASGRLLLGDPWLQGGESLWSTVDASWQQQSVPHHHLAALLYALYQHQAWAQAEVCLCLSNAVWGSGQWRTEEPRLMHVLSQRARALGFAPRFLVVLPPPLLNQRFAALDAERRRLWRRQAQSVGWHCLDPAIELAANDYQLGPQVRTAYPQGPRMDRFRQRFTRWLTAP